MKNHLSNLLFIYTILISFSFGYNPINKKENLYQKIKKTSTSDKKTMVLITYQIKDFAKWDKANKGVLDSSVSATYLKKADSTLNIGVYQFTNSHNDFRKKIETKQFIDHSKKAGISSSPKYLYLNTMWLNSVQPKKAYNIIITHKVADYVKWKVDFDANRQNRGFIGITDVFVATHEKDINSVTMALATDNYEMTKALFTDEEVIAVMKKAGVVGELDISYWKVITN